MCVLCFTVFSVRIIPNFPKGMIGKTENRESDRGCNNNDHRQVTYK